MSVCPDQCLLQTFADPIMLTDASGVIRLTNSALEEISGYSSAELLGKTPRVLKSEKHSGDFYHHFWKTILSGQSYRGVFTNCHKNGEIYHEDKTVSPVFDKRGAITHFLSIGKDVTHRVEERNYLTHLAYYDDLTGLPNRPLLQDRLTHALRRALRNKSRLSVMFVDLDQFKNINDTLGHAAGDELLRQTAKRILSCLRDCDTVSRISGDEFVIILEGLNEIFETTITAEKIMHAIAQPLWVQHHKIAVTSSIGITVGPAPGDNEDTLLRKADVAMYSAKQHGRNNFQHFSADLLHMYRQFNARDQMAQ